jgi:glycosyltransferase involved in cell wall biosynthesis
MRILFATAQWFPDFKGGSGRVAANVAVGLARRGHSVTVLVPQIEGLPAFEVPEPGLTVHRVLRRTRWPKTLVDPVRTRREARRLRAQRFDVLVGHQSTTTLGLWAARLDLPVVSVFHASALRELRFLRSQLPFGLERLRTYPLALPLTCFERLAARRAASEIVALSEFSRSLLREDHGRAGERARILPAGIDLDRFSPADGMAAARTRLGADPDAPLLVTVRRLEPRMGVEQLLRAVQRLADRRLTLVVVGRGRLDAALRSLSAELGLEREVRFVGSVPDDELGDWYRAADLFVLPTAAYEGFGMVTAEALASGTPVVGTPVGATPELLAPLDPRLVARGTDADALADAISEALALTGPEFRRRCREYASERFSLETKIAEWERALVETVDIAPGPAPPRGCGGRRTRPTSSSNASLSSTTVGPET